MVDLHTIIDNKQCTIGSLVLVVLQPRLLSHATRMMSSFRPSYLLNLNPMQIICRGANSIWIVLPLRNVPPIALGLHVRHDLITPDPKSLDRRRIKVGSRVTATAFQPSQNHPTAKKYKYHLSISFSSFKSLIYQLSTPQNVCIHVPPQTNHQTVRLLPMPSPLHHIPSNQSIARDGFLQGDSP